MKGDHSIRKLLMNFLSGIRHPVSGIVALLLIYVCSGTACAGENKTIEEYNEIPGKKAEKQTNPVLYPVNLFRKYISVTDGNRCPMYPTCSQYCVESFRKNGIVMGWIMSCDRIMRCGGNETDLSSPVWIKGEKRIHDPVSHNDFWWK